MNSTKKSFLVATAILVFVSFALVASAFAQGFIIPRPMPHPNPTPLLTDHKVDVKIIDQVATVTVDQVFYNDSKRAVEGVYYFPLPENASISDFKMYADGKLLSGEILEKDKARKIYEDIVRRNLDPALLEYVNQNLFSASIFPIPPNKDRKIVLEYSVLLPLDGDLVKFSYPLRGAMATGRGVRPPVPLPRPIPLDENLPHPPGEKISDINQVIAIDIQSQIPLKAIYSPSHDVDISKQSDSSAKVSYEGKRETSTDNFVLYYSYSRKDFGMNLLTFKSPDDESNFFMLLVSPKTEFSKKEIIDKDILFVLDVSGSMSGEKIKQAQEALTYCINSLDDKDRFNIITFSTETKAFNEKLVKASANRNDALRFIKDIEAKGGTNIHDALAEAVAMKFEKNRANSIVFLTDGLPTVGETDISSILKNTSEKNRSNIKIFTFGVGYDVNTTLLDKIAMDSRAVSDYIEPNEQIEQKVSSFYDKISHPVLTELKLDFGRIDVEDVFPKKLPDLFKSSQLAILGTYKKSAKAEISLSGRAGENTEKFTYEADFSDKGEGHEFLPHLWAMRKIGFLMDEIRLHGENDELKEEVIRLSKKYGVMSPYTSYLVQEDNVMAQQLPTVMPKRTGNGKSDRFVTFEAQSMQNAANAPAAPLAKDKGMFAVKASKEAKRMKEASAVEESATVRRVGSRTFYLKDNVWVDSEYADEKTFDVKRGSEAYMDVLLKFPGLGRIFALGDKVIFKWQDRFIKIGDTGTEKLKSSELLKIFQ